MNVKNIAILAAVAAVAMFGGVFVRGYTDGKGWTKATG